MKILVDTNILVSAVLFPHGLANQALVRAVESDAGQDNSGILCRSSRLDSTATWTIIAPTLSIVLYVVGMRMGDGVVPSPIAVVV